jgi:hypothetical protein
VRMCAHVITILLFADSGICCLAGLLFPYRFLPLVCSNNFHQVRMLRSWYGWMISQPIYFAAKNAQRT